MFGSPPLTAYPAMYGPMAHHYGNDVTALTPGSTEGSAHGKRNSNTQNKTKHKSSASPILYYTYTMPLISSLI